MVEEEKNIFSPPFYLHGQTQGTWDCALNMFNAQAALTGWAKAAVGLSPSYFCLQNAQDKWIVMI